MNSTLHIKQLIEEGVTVVPHVYSRADCERFIKIAENVVEKFKSEKRPLSPTCQVIENPFRHDRRFAELVYHEYLEAILGHLLDDQFVLINANVINRRIRSDVEPGGLNIGEFWHTDSRSLGGRRLDAGFSYIAMTTFTDCGPDNGSTRYVPGSHHKREIPERHGQYPFKSVNAEAGSIAIFDTGLWHRGGEPGYKDRWGMYAYYGPWFMKPYYRFPEMLDKEFGETLSPQLKRLFHYNSIPPLHEDERRNTVIK